MGHRKSGFRQLRIALVDQPEHRERSPAEQVQMGMDRRELEALAHPHDDTETDAADQAKHRKQNEMDIDSGHSDLPGCCSHLETKKDCISRWLQQPDSAGKASPAGFR